jgi:hypothetical protein
MTVGRPTANWSLTDEERVNVRRAMFSVYQRSLGRQWQLQGAPTVLLPPEVRPLDLADALDILRRLPHRGRLADAIWRIIRSVPLRPDGDDQPSLVERRFPALADLVGSSWLSEVDRRRRAYRVGANLFAVALEAKAQGRDEVAGRLLGILEEQSDEKPAPGNFSSAIGSCFGLSVRELLDTLTEQVDPPESPIGSPRRTLRQQLATLEDEVGRTTQELMTDFAEAAAYYDSPLPPQLGGGWGTTSDTDMTVYPVSSGITQNSATLTTTSTVTTIVRGAFPALAAAVNPLNWPEASDVFVATEYVQDPISLRPLVEPVTGHDDGRHMLLREKVQFTWGARRDHRGEFEALLNSSFKVHEPLITLKFSLCRSISSRVLWDSRSGGILVDAGYIKARPVSDGCWRVTSRKVLRFSDRTPGFGETGWFDQGKLLNYLAPAAMSWWIESETYSVESHAYHQEPVQTKTAL